MGTTDRARRALLVAVVTAGLVACGGSAQAGPVARPAVPIGTAVLTALTVNGAATVNGPATVNMDATHAGLTINGRAGNDEQLLRIFDHNGWPIAGVNSAGGMWVTGDDFKVFPPGDVFNASVTLHKDGAISIGGYYGPTIYGGKDGPIASPPCVTLAMIHAGPVPAALDRPCMGGDRYFQSGGNYDTWVFTGTWVVK